MLPISSFTSAIYYQCDIGKFQSSHQSNGDELSCSSYTIDVMIKWNKNVLNFFENSNVIYKFKFLKIVIIVVDTI